MVFLTAYNSVIFWLSTLKKLVCFGKVDEHGLKFKESQNTHIRHIAERRQLWF